MIHWAFKVYNIATLSKASGYRKTILLTRATFSISYSKSPETWEGKILNHHNHV